jgi:serine/threonine protein kinase/WD40 repeat protein
MNGGSDPRLPALFAQARSLPPAARAAFLANACGGDDALRREIEELLAFDTPPQTTLRRPDHPIDGPPLVAGADLAAAFADASIEATGDAYPPGTVVDQFTIVREVGRGGFGVVYLAMQAPGDRPVALKLMPDAGVSPRLMRRFARERRALANLHHPGIAQIFTDGRTAHGHPYFAMEFVAGADGRAPASTITAYADRERRTLRQRLELFVRVCHAVQHAHQQGIVHRDLKPSNLLVAEAEGTASPKVIDFGIARRFEKEPIGPGHSPRDPHTLQTLSIEITGTPTYMSPEQAGNLPVDARCDVYSLGVVLYELLCGASPLPMLAHATSATEQLHIVRNDEPVRASRAMARAPVAVAAARRSDPRRLARQLRGDLDTVLLRALEKDPTRRFRNAGELADDLQRHLDHQPIESRRATLRYTVGKFARRHRRFVVAATALLLTLLATTAFSLDMARTASAAQRKADLMATMANLRAAELAMKADDGGALDRALLDIGAEHRDFEWHCLDRLRERLVRRVKAGGGLVSALAHDAAGRRLLAGDRNGTTVAWDLATMQQLPLEIRNPPNRRGNDTWALAISPDGNLLATGSFDHHVRVYDAAGVRLWEAGGYAIAEEIEWKYETVYAVAFSHDGTRLAIAGGHGDGTSPPYLALVDARSGTGIWLDTTSHGAAVNDVAFRADDRWLASGDDHGLVCRFPLDGAMPGPVERTTVEGKVNDVTWSPDGRTLAVGTTKSVIHLLPAADGGARRVLVGHLATVADSAFSADGSRLASASWDSTIRLWSVADGKQLAVLRGHRSRVNRVVFVPDGDGGERLFSASDDETVAEWDVRVEPQLLHDFGQRPIQSAHLLADGSLVVDDSSAHLVIVGADGVMRHEAPAVAWTALDPTHATCTWIEPDGTVAAWTVGTGLRTYPAPPAPAGSRRGLLAIDADSLLLADATSLMRLDLDTGRWQPLPSAVPPMPIQFFGAWSPAPGTDPITVWQTDDGQARVAHGTSGPLPDGLIANFPTAGRLVPWSTGDGRRIAVYDLASNRIVATLVGHREQVRAAALAPNRRRLASIDRRGTLNLWDWQQELLVLSIDHPANQPSAGAPANVQFTSVAWSHDSLTLVTGSSNGAVQRWSGRPR